MTERDRIVESLSPDELVQWLSLFGTLPRVHPQAWHARTSRSAIAVERDPACIKQFDLPRFACAVQPQGCAR